MAKAKTSITTENRSGSAADAAAKEQRTEMPLSDLHPFEGHPFKVLDDELMEQTVESIKQIGVVSPLIVRPDPEGGFEILSGHRRLHAAQLAGLETVPVIVKDVTDEQAMELALVENLQREDLNPMEEAQALQQLRETLKLTQEALAARIGKSRPAIANALRLLQLSPAAQDDLHHGRLSAGHARCLLALGNDDRALAAAEVLRSHIISESLSVRQAEEAVALWREEQRLPWTTASEAAPQRPVFLHCLQGVFRAGGDIPAAGRKQRRHGRLIKPDGPQDGPLHDGSSRSRSSCLRSRR